MTYQASQLAPRRPPLKIMRARASWPSGTTPGGNSGRVQWEAPPWFEVLIPSSGVPVPSRRRLWPHRRARPTRGEGRGNGGYGGGVWGGGCCLGVRYFACMGHEWRRHRRWALVLHHGLGALSRCVASNNVGSLAQLRFRCRLPV